MKKVGSFSLIILSFLLFQACNGSGNGSKQKADSINKANKPMAQNASDFMVDAAMINRTEITLGTIAKEKAATSRVKNLATMIVNDHKTAKRKLADLAKQKGVVLPQSLNKKHKEDSASLDSKEGMSLDQVFVSDMVKGHKAAIDRFEKAKRDISDADVRAYITMTLPTLHKHLDSAETIQDYMQGQSEEMRK